jgi:hypothetical protein
LHAYNVSTQEAEAGGLQAEFEAILRYIASNKPAKTLPPTKKERKREREREGERERERERDQHKTGLEKRD